MSESPIDPAVVGINFTHYVGILEAVVALLCIKSGMDPEALVGRTIEDITEQSGLETRETERIIRDRWSGRDVPAKTLVSHVLPSFEKPSETTVLEPTPEPVDWAARARDRAQRRKTERANVSSAQSADSDVSESN